MTEAFVSFAVQKLGDFLIQKVSLRKNLRKEVESLRNELLFIQSFLREAEQKQSGDQRVQQWVFEINSIANEAVAILETYSFEAGKRASHLKAFACICRKEKKFYNVAEEIQSLKQRITDISRKRETYGITNINNAGEGSSNQVRKLRRTTSYVDDQDNIFVGLQDVVQKLLAELLKAEPRRSVISIHGMGGLGKTTLARNLYNSPNIVSSFPTRAWICVSQEYNTMDLLKNIIKSIQGRTKGTLEFLERMTESDLEIYLRDLLKEGKYLVVVDDVWQREAWESLKRAFPDSKNGSRVIITTRKHDVAERADNRGFVHNLRFLTREEGWDLFCRKQLDVRAMVPEMVRIARDMVEKCRGLPLAIVVLSGLLSHKRGLGEWQKVKDHFWQNIQDDSIEISYILSLSYNDLSATLKQCFLYFGVFPEDQEVDAEKIILLWMAEGLIPNGEERMEDVAEGFLNELIRRSLIQEMVDAAFVSFAVKKLGDFLIQEASLRLSLRQDVQWLRNELFFMQSFLKDAEQRQVEDQRVQQWVFEINSVANDVVAILETYSFEAGKVDDNRLASRLKAYTCICRKEAKFYNVNKEIHSLKHRIMDISRKRETYGIRDINNAGEGPSNRPNNQSDMVRTLRRTTSYVDEDHIFVGFQDVVQTLIAELLKAEPHRSIISIYGMGGLGKTTLARNLYISPNIVSSFHTRAWICVSQEYDTMDLLRNIIKSIQGCTKETLDLLERMTERDLEIYLHDLLTEPKYLVVVDDVWHREAWESLKRAFPDRKNGSRVIITTCKEDVAERADNKGFVYRLRFLSQEESWDFFCRKLLDVRAMVSAMERLAKDMVDKCGGLPLAIVVLSGLLSHKRGLEEWKKVKDNLWQNIKDDSIEVSHMLSLSYNDLSTALKQCFLYFGIFPEDRVVHVDHILWLWMAEGFVPTGFLNELIRRSLIQVVRTFWEKVNECRIHDLLRDLAVQKALEVNFLDIYDPRKHSISSFCLRHSIHSQGKRYLSLDLSNFKLRSLMFLDPDFLKMGLIKFRNVFQHLYVLYLEIHVDNKYSIVPDAIGSLYHLKFLRLRGIYDLPSSIGNLKNLQTLLVNDYGYSCQLPREKADLINLRHLVAPYSKPLKRISKLTSLQVLKGVGCDQWKDVDPIDLVNLRELSMHYIKKSYSLNNISSLKNLSTLRLLGGQSFPDLEFLYYCEKLQKLWLDGRIEKLPLLPNSITMMVLLDSKLMEDPMPILGMLPNLRKLEFLRAYQGKEIFCSDNSFRQLEFLSLACLENLDTWHLATSAMLLIKGLRIDHCKKLNKIPQRMKDSWHSATSPMLVIKGLGRHECLKLHQIPKRMKIQRLGDFLIQEVNLRLSLREEVHWLRNELLFMQPFLKDAEQKQSGDHRVQQWVFEINSVANDTRDIQLRGW
ncbi:hypothetical protein H5410_058821 [Solanum commersonii]|uniref:Rpi protein n=1 Tax=Solanum commersonii TaxID=4109 RepID=A0A9J5W115_SOLCO|nr:hypothetical protein H5410_058821 [Solanum commersonii]